MNVDGFLSIVVEAKCKNSCVIVSTFMEKTVQKHTSFQDF